MHVEVFPANVFPGLDFRCPGNSTCRPNRANPDSCGRVKSAPKAHSLVYRDACRAGPADTAPPRWIPGDHQPVGPISDLVGLKIRAAGSPLAWDPCTGPTCTPSTSTPGGRHLPRYRPRPDSCPRSDGATQAPPRRRSCMVFYWSSVVLYPKGPDTDSPHLSGNPQHPRRLEKYGTALPVEIIRREPSISSPVPHNAGRFACTCREIFPNHRFESGRRGASGHSHRRRQPRSHSNHAGAGRFLAEAGEGRGGRLRSGPLSQLSLSVDPERPHVAGGGAGTS